MIYFKGPIKEPKDMYVILLSWASKCVIASAWPSIEKTLTDGLRFYNSFLCLKPLGSSKQTLNYY